MVETCKPGIIITHRCHKSLFTLSLELEGISLNSRNEEINTTRTLLPTLISAAVKAPV